MGEVALHTGQLALYSGHRGSDFLPGRHTGVAKWLRFCTRPGRISMPSGHANGDSKSGKAKDTHAIVEKWFPISPSGLGASRHSSNQKGKTMKALDLKKGGANLAVALAAVAGMSVFGIDAAMAGTDSTFDTALTQFTNFLEG